MRITIESDIKSRSFHFSYHCTTNFVLFLLLFQRQMISTESEDQPSFLGNRAVGVHFHTGHNGHSARRNGLGRLLDLYETHATIAGDRESVVVAETRDLDSYFVACLCERGRYIEVGRVGNGVIATRRIIINIIIIINNNNSNILKITLFYREKLLNIYSR